MADEFVLGMDAGLYYSDYAATPVDIAAMTLLDNVKDVTVTLESAEADYTTRANSGWRATTKTLKECTIEFQMVWQPGEAAFEKVRDAYLAKATLLHLAALDQLREEEGAQGPNADFSITRFVKTEPIEGVQMVDVTAKLARYISWIEVAAS